MDNSTAKEFFACLALKHGARIGPRTSKALLEAYGTAFAAVQDAASWGANKLARKDVVERFLDETWRKEAEFEYKAARFKGMQVLSWSDERYPEKLRNIPDPPLVLYYMGDISLMSNPSLAVVGARKCTEYGLKQARAISQELSRNGLTIVSGLALGIDRQAHLGGLSGIGSSIAVVGAGLDHRYPVENADVRASLENRGLVLSEYPPGTIPDAKHFPYRNRIISGLSLGVLVAEAANKSGSLITARLAGEQGRDVFALPGPLGQPTFVGCHTLLKQGACLVQSAEEVLHELSQGIGVELDLDALKQEIAFSKEVGKATEEDFAAGVHAAKPAQPAMPMNLEGDEAEVFKLLRPVERTHIDDIGRNLGWDSPRVSQVLLMLEVKGHVRQWPGMNYTHV